jgi:hypothetical protein
VLPPSVILVEKRWAFKFFNFTYSHGRCNGIAYGFTLYLLQKELLQSSVYPGLRDLPASSLSAGIAGLCHPGQVVQETKSSKITRVKTTGGVAQVAKHLCCNHKDLSSNPSVRNEYSN